MVGFFSTYCCVFLLKRLMWMIRYCGNGEATHRRLRGLEAATRRGKGCNPRWQGLQPNVAEAATRGGRGYNPTWQRLQPEVSVGATLCYPGCSPVC